MEDLISEIFPMETEDAIINWNGISIPLSYKYDISVIYTEIIEMVDTISSRPSGIHEVNWSSDTFNAKWNLKWDSSALECDSRWNSTSGTLESLLNHHSWLQIPVSDFTAEWGYFLNFLLRILMPYQRTINGSQDFDNLIGLCAKLPIKGKLYR